jgi:hypothetical protein
MFFKPVSSTNLARACGDNQRQACPTSQSTSGVQGLQASIANDGSTGDDWSHTDGAPGVCGAGYDTMTPWWMVDFGYTRSIGGGQIWGRPAMTGCNAECLARLTGFQIWVGSSNSAYNAAGNMKCYTSTTTEETQAPHTHAFECAANGRYLFVVLTTGRCLSMREIEVYSMGEEQDVVSGPKTAARDWLDKIRAGLEQNLDSFTQQTAGVDRADTPHAMKVPAAPITRGVPNL